MSMTIMALLAFDLETDLKMKIVNGFDGLLSVSKLKKKKTILKEFNGFVFKIKPKQDNFLYKFYIIKVLKRAKNIDGKRLCKSLTLLFFLNL